MSTRRTVVPMVRQPPEFTFADRLRKVRREVGKDQEEFAVMLGVKKSKIASAEAGIRPVPPDQVWALAHQVEKLTGFPATWLVTGNLTSEDDPTPSQRPRVDSNHRPTAYNSRRKTESRGLVAA